MALHKSLGAIALVLVAGLHNSADACWWWGNSGYTAGYAPYSAGYGPTYGYGYSSTSYYNPFAAMFGSPYYGNYGGMGYGSGYASNCSTCGSGNCSTGNCDVSTTNRTEPIPDNPPRMDAAPMPTYDPMDKPKAKVPMDDPNFRNSQPGTENEFPNVDGATGAFKIPTDSTDAGDQPSPESTPNVDPLKGTETLKDKSTDGSIEAPTPEVNFAPTLIDPRNSAQLQPINNIDHKITWRSAPVIVRQAERVPTSRPLIVRSTIKVTPEMSEGTLRSMPIVRK